VARPSDSADVVVLGSGMAGMCAATAASEAGAKVLLIERAPAVGGSAAISGGYVWTARDLESLENEDAGEFQRHGHLVVEGYEDVKRWLTSFTAPVTEELPTLYGRGHKFDIPYLFGNMAATIATAGGRIWTGAEVTDVARDADGFTLSVRRDDGTSTVAARALVLATGGRQVDPDVRRSLVEGGSLLPPLRGNAFSRGEGAAIASALGGHVNTANKGFYGHLFAYGVAPLAPVDFIIFSLFQSSEGVLLNASGRRFTEETRGDHNNAAAVAAHGGRALLLWSEEVQERAATTPWTVGTPLTDRWRLSRDRGGRTTSAAGPDELTGLVGEWGYELQPAAFDDGVVRERIGTGRIFAADVVPAVTMTFGGIEIDDDGLVEDSGGTGIPGLFAAGGDASDIYHRGYAGGLCAAAVTGRRAGTSAAPSVRGRNEFRSVTMR
jgi:succinate dehydrogenase/fumarate reductase flavoprotein subunit